MAQGEPISQHITKVNTKRNGRKRDPEEEVDVHAFEFYNRLMQGPCIRHPEAADGQKYQG